VHGVDLFDGEFEEARAVAEAEGLPVTFQAASVYELPFEDGSFDSIFSHALLEHLADPVAALVEMMRVLQPGGVIGVCSPDWGGFIVTPPSDKLTRALERYVDLQRANGGDPFAGRHLGEWALQTGLVDVRLDARYERYEQPERIGEYLALQLDDVDANAARTLRGWAEQPAAMFAQSWVSAMARRPAATHV
jgi:SAM-dependent methyltransferase